MTQTLRLGVIMLLLVASITSARTLDRAHSSLTFISIKKNAIAEINQFRHFKLNIDNTGHFSLKIDLKSLATGVPIRDQRLRDQLFEVIRFPNANVSGQFDPRLLSLKVGELRHVQLHATLSLHGYRRPLIIPLTVFSLADGRLRISAQNVVLDSRMFGLANGIKELQALAKLDAISSAIPINFVLTLSR